MSFFLADFHSHSDASDGSLSPARLVAEALKRGLNVLALTDHDTIGGLDEARAAAADTGLRFIPGVELQIEWDAPSGGEFHLLGLGISQPEAALNGAIAELSRRREERNLEIIERMNEFNIEVSYDDIKALSGGHSVGRPHFARFLIEKKIVKNVEQAFGRYLARGKPFYAPKAGLPFERAASAIKASGGRAVMAHPLSLFVSWGKLPEILAGFKERGLDGIEAWHPAARVTDCKRLAKLGAELGLPITAGSDFHGASRPERKLGETAGGRKIDEKLLPDLVASSEGRGTSKIVW